MLGLQALTPDGYRSGQLKNVDPTDAMLRARVTAGDLLVSRSNTIHRVGFAAIFSEERQDVSFPDTMMRLRVDEDQVDLNTLPAFSCRLMVGDTFSGWRPEQARA